MEERQEFGGELECVEDEIELAVSGGDLEFGRGLEFGGELECVEMRLNLLFQEEMLSWEEDWSLEGNLLKLIRENL